MSKANLANAVLAAPINTSATSATLVAGYGATMPPVPFKLTFTPFGQLSTRGNSEIVLVTARSGEVLTIERAKNGTSAKSFETGDVVSNGVYIENSTAVGDIFMSMRATPADGRLFMDGGTYNKADWPLLYKLVQDNTAYGTTGGGVGTETFTLADMRERMPFGKSQSSPFNALGYKMGTKEETLTIAQMPSHNHKHRQWVFNGSGASGNHYGFGYQGGTGAAVDTNSAGSSSEVQYGNFPTGGGEAHNNMPPVIVVNYEVIAG